MYRSFGLETLKYLHLVTIKIRVHIKTISRQPEVNGNTNLVEGEQESEGDLCRMGVLLSQNLCFSSFFVFCFWWRQEGSYIDPDYKAPETQMVTFCTSTITHGCFLNSKAQCK